MVATPINAAALPAGVYLLWFSNAAELNHGDLNVTHNLNVHVYRTLHQPTNNGAPKSLTILFVIQRITAYFGYNHASPEAWQSASSGPLTTTRPARPTT